MRDAVREQEKRINTVTHSGLKKIEEAGDENYPIELLQHSPHFVPTISPDTVRGLFEPNFKMDD